MKNNRKVTILIGFATALIAACGKAPPKDSGPEVVHPHQALTNVQATKQIGESCDSAYGAECLSGIAVHIKPQNGIGDFCTIQCGPAAAGGGGGAEGP